jgi:hypothetical protein
MSHIKERSRPNQGKSCWMPKFTLSLFLLLLLSGAYTLASVPSSDDLKKGERIFHGFIPAGRKNVSCASCHNLSPVDTLNWNPSAFDISSYYRTKTDTELESVLMNPVGKKIEVAHQGIDLASEEIAMLKSYMDQIAVSGSTKPKPVINQLLLFVLAVILILSALGDLIFTRLVRFKLVHLVIILGSSLFILKTTVHEAIAIGRSMDYEPDQPIKFSHQVHARDNKIDCKYCHTSTDDSHTAGFPSTNHCLNCHSLVREGTRSGRWEINKIHQSLDSAQHIQWVRIHNLPDHVFFSHAQHVNAGKLDCSECHGTVEDMHVVRQVEDLSMGWCIDCHRTKEVQFIDNAFYETYKDLHEDIKTGKIKQVTPEMVGANECMRCHY